MSKKLKVGVFGGARGRTMIEVLLHHPDAELVAVCDKYKPLLDDVQKRADELGVKVQLFEKFDDFFNCDMDAVVMANYANEHSIFGTKLLRSGRHILSEVLPCETMAQAVDLIDAVEESGKVYAYAENYCYMQHCFEMWKRYKRGDIGEVMYAEGEYVHNCASIWPQITYGERDHWRNNMFATFYCTHSLGPMLSITNTRPVRVVGFETKPLEKMRELGAYGGAGLEIVTVDNGAVFKSIHGGLTREPSSVNYEIYGQKGMMESSRLDGKVLNVYRETGAVCQGDWEKYDPVNDIAADKAKNYSGHGGSDFYSTHFWIEKILGNPDGEEWSIDVYRAVDMGICGILAWRSVCQGNVPIDVPDLRNIAERNKYRHDNIGVNPRWASGKDLLPKTTFGEPDYPDSTFEYVRQLWLDGKNAE
ncbi:MAG: Gfo/Idh/MocA family oxidoreductase [Clostridiales bacterium]|nr:Gfo/Idh/MocA family oxidoreductase [Clostridiales bacterium]